MCGIVAYVGAAPCAPILLEALKRLEYRGYDSAGVAVHDNVDLGLLRAVGKLVHLEEALRLRPLQGSTGIGHTRWATHGRPSEENAHPHVVGDVALVHNGIIENHLALRRQLEASGSRFASDTDTEIVAHLVAAQLRQGAALPEAVRQALSLVEGAYAIAVVSRRDPHSVVVAKQASPLVIGLGDGATFCASDIAALLPHTRRMIFLEDGDLAVLRREGVELFDAEGQKVDRPVRHIDWSPMMAEKAGYKHFMLKEIFEQPQAVEDTLRGRLRREAGEISEDEIGLSRSQAQGIRRVVLLGCGTSHHAAMLGRAYIESLARLPAVAELAGEFRERDAIVGEGDLVIAMSQSGETIDTLHAARTAKQRGATLLAIANVVGSAIPRHSDAAFYTHAGPEIGVASTKCFSAQLAALLMLGIYLGRSRGVLEPARARLLVEAMARLPQQMEELLSRLSPQMLSLARRHRDARDVLYLGRGWSYPIALEGALKLKEISYVHAEGYAAGEMKHGPIALIDSEVPVFVLVPRDGSYQRTLGNLQEAKARDAQVVAIATEGDTQVSALVDDCVCIPAVEPELSPLLSILPLQLFAYHFADLKGTDVDQPRNLAKTVTVE